MESKKINQLATELTPSLTDLTIIGDPTTGISKKITLSQMAALFTGTVEEYASFAALPLVGVADTIYITTNTNILYRWDTTLSAYVELSPNIISSLVFNDSNGFDGTISLVGSTATLTITTTLTGGSVAFGGASGALSQDNDNFFWDNSNKRLGIATKVPTTALDVFGSGIIGRLNATSTNNAYLGFASNGTNRWSIGNVQSDHRFRIYNEAGSLELISILPTGEFGIGVANPTTKFHIDGGASALIMNLDADTSIAKSISFRTNNNNRWNVEVSGTESGSNAGMDYFLRSYTDAGALIETPLSIVRSTGVTTIKSLTLTNALSIANGGTGSTTQNFVDLTTAQTIAGAKTFSSTITTEFFLRSNGGIMQIFQNSAFRGGIYTYNQWLGSGTDYSMVFGSNAELNLIAGGGTTKQVVLTTSGNFGIGVTNPDIFSRGDARMVGIGASGASDNMALALNAGASGGRGAQIYMGQGGTRHFTISSNVTESRVGTTSSTPLIFTTNDVTRLTLASTTGAATFTSTLTATGSIIATGGDTTGTNVAIVNTSTGGIYWNLFSGGSAASLGPVGSFIFRDSTAGATRLVLTSGGLLSVGNGTAAGYGVLGSSNLATSMGITFHNGSTYSKVGGVISVQESGGSHATEIWVRAGGTEQNGLRVSSGGNALVTGNIVSIDSKKQRIYTATQAIAGGGSTNYDFNVGSNSFISILVRAGGRHVDPSGGIYHLYGYMFPNGFLNSHTIHANGLSFSYSWQNSYTIRITITNGNAGNTLNLALWFEISSTLAQDF